MGICHVPAFHSILIFGNEMLKNEQRLHQWAELWVIDTMPAKFIYNKQLPGGKQIFPSWTIIRRIICQVCFPLELRIFFILSVPKIFCMASLILVILRNTMLWATYLQISSTSVVQQNKLFFRKSFFLSLYSLFH